MQLELHVAGLVLLAAVMHAGWNALVKTGRDRVLTLAVVTGVGSAVAALLLPLIPLPAAESWKFLLLSGIVHVGYFFFLLQAYRVGDLSHVYPVARGVAPLLVAVAAAVFVNEPVSVNEISGLLLIAMALGSFAFERTGPATWDARPLLFALATATIIATYTILDGLGVRRSNHALSYILWLLFIDGLPLTAYVLATRRREVRRYLRLYWRPSVAGGVMCAGAYGLVIWALNLGAMAYVSALRETSVIFAAVIGATLLREPFGRRRIVAATLVAAGVLIMNLRG